MRCVWDFEENWFCSPGTGWQVRFYVERSLNFGAALVKLVADVVNILNETFDILSHIF